MFRFPRISTLLPSSRTRYLHCPSVRHASNKAPLPTAKSSSRPTPSSSAATPAPTSGPTEYKGRLPRPEAVSKTPLETNNEAIKSNKPEEYSAPRVEAQPVKRQRTAEEQKEYEARYKDVSRRITRILVGSPIAIYLTYVLYEKVILGKDKQRPSPIFIKEATDD